MSKTWVVVCDDYATVCSSRAVARQAAKLLNTYPTCPNHHSVLELDAWNLLADVDLDELRDEVNDIHQLGFTYANVYQNTDGAARVVTLKSRESARYVHRCATQPRDYVVPAAAVEAALHQRTFR